MSITFAISYKDRHLEVATQRADYDDLLEFVQKTLALDDREETFIYAIPNDHSGHIRLCQRLLGSMFHTAENNAGSCKVSLKVYTASSFIQVGNSQQQGSTLPLTQIPKSTKPSCRNNRYGGNSKYSNNTSTTGSYVDPKHFAQKTQPQGPTLVSNAYPGTPGTQQTPQKAVPSLPQRVPTVVRTKHADAIDQFYKNYQVSSSEFNVSIEANHNASTPAEHKAGDNYSLSLVLKALGTSNIGKDFALCKIAGNGSPPSFSLPLLKPQVQRTISISVEFSDDDETSFWAIKQVSTNHWVGSILALTVLKMQKKVLVRTIEFAEAQKLLEHLKTKTI